MPDLIVPSASRAIAVPMESPDALFAPDARIQTPTPAPLLLFQCIRFPLRTHYETDEHGLIVRREDRYQENAVVFPDGSRFTAMVSGSERFGLPLVCDIAGLLGILRMAERDGWGPDGLVSKPTFGRLVNARNPGAAGTTNQIDSVKRMLERFGNTTVTGEFSRVLGADGSRSEEQTTRWILEYDRRSLYLGSEVKHHIKELKINPFWLKQTEDRRLTSWIDVDLLDRQAKETSKIAYLRLAIAARQGHLDALRELTLEGWEELIGAAASGKMTERAKQVENGLRDLEDQGVLSGVQVKKTGKTRSTVYTFSIEPGPGLTALRHFDRIDADDQPRHRVHLWHLQHLGIAEAEARSLLGRYGERVQEVLRRVHWLRTVKEGKDGHGRPIAHWRSWIVKALVEGWTFEEPGYAAWVEAQQRRFTAPAEPALVGPVAASSKLERQESRPADPEIRLPDNLWGHALAALVEETGIHRPALQLLSSCWLEESTETEVRVGVPDAGAAAVIERVHARHLGPILQRLTGRPVDLVLTPGRPEESPLL